jgi:NADPH2:quinone reductase
MSHAIVIHETGGPEVLRWEEVEVGRPGPGQARVRHTAVGVNFIDVYLRSGLYRTLDLPGIPGMEGAGVVEDIGEGVTEVKVGDRVAYACLPPGAYAEERVMPADHLVIMPDKIDDRMAAAMMLKGMTAEYLLHRTHKVTPEQAILVHAAAGGVGLLLCQWAHHIGATVIGTVSSVEKAALAEAHGCDHPIVYTREDFVERVKEITGGRGVNVVYDGIGKDTFLKSLDCLARFGHLVSFGQASGAVEPFNLGLLSAQSASVTRPTLFHYTAAREDLESITRNLADAVGSGIVKIEVNQTYPLREAAAAHRDLESRKTTGSTVLVP